MKQTLHTLTFLLGCLSLTCHGASVVRGDVDADLGPDFLVNDAALGGADVTINEPGSFQLTRTFLRSNAGADGTNVTITGIGFALPNAAAVIDATSLEVRISHLGPDDALGTADDVLLGTEAVDFAFDGVGEYSVVFDTPMTGVVAGPVRRYHIEIFPSNDTGEGTLRLKSGALAFENFAGPKISIAGTTSAIGEVLFFDADRDGLSDAAETGTGAFVDANNTGTNPFNRDTDGDGLGDSFEIENGLNAFDGLADLDGDGFTDADEVFFYGTDPDNIDEFPGDANHLGPGELTPLIEYNPTDVGPYVLPFPGSPVGTLETALINEAQPGGGDLNHANGVTPYSIVYPELFPEVGTSVSITGLGFVAAAGGSLSGDVLAEFYDLAAADGDDDFDGIDSETKVGSATGTLTVGATGIYFWAFEEPVTFTSAGRGLAVRLLFSEQIRLKAQDNFATGQRVFNDGSPVPLQNSMRLTIFGTDGNEFAVVGSGFDENGDFFIEGTGSLEGKIVTRSADLVAPFAAVPSATQVGNRFIVPSADLSPIGREFFRIEDAPAQP